MRALIPVTVLGLALMACGSEQSKLERGVTVDREVAVPTSDAELAETEAERRADEEREVERKSRAEFERAQE